MDNMIKCHQCGTLIQKTKNRLFCMECSKERNRAQIRARVAAEQAANKAVARKTLTKAEREQRDRERLKRKQYEEALKKEDEKLDAKTREQMKQCRKCDYYGRDGILEYCDYTSHTGRLLTVEDGKPVRYKPGHCGQFKSRKPRTKADRLARSRKSLFEVEANNAQNTGEKMREVNTL